jgi:asparagine synthase (glutamine-hydrolysing)
MLWTTPESLREKLPLQDRGRTLVITADARLDNRDDLLRLLPHMPRTCSDSELILEAYVKWGESCPTKLIGDFSFAIWDRIRHILFAARDRIGVKPFYYHQRDDLFAFCSDISPLFRALALPKRIDPDAIREIFNALALAFDRTLFENVRRLPPACTLVLRDGQSFIRRYWEPVSSEMGCQLPRYDYAEELRHLLAEAIQTQSRSAYPVGVLLSGGLDSSSVACLGSRVDHTNICSFSLLFDGLPCDERDFIAETVLEAGIDSVVSILNPALFNGWSSLATSYASDPDWPTQSVPLQFISPLLLQAKSRGVRVMLTGGGGDELMQGSPYYMSDLLASFKWFTFAKELTHYGPSFNVLWYWTLEPLLSARLPAVTRFVSRLARRQVDQLSGTRAARVWKEPSHLSRNRFSTASGWQEALYMTNPRKSIIYDSWWNTLSRVGTMEFRHPFLDTRVIEFVLSLPCGEKRKHGMKKWVLREAMKGVIPDLVRLRTSKAELSAVLRSAVDTISTEPSSFILTRAGILDASQVGKVVNSYEYGSPIDAFMMWQLVQLEAWYRLHGGGEEYGQDREENDIQEKGPVREAGDAGQEALQLARLN